MIFKYMLQNLLHSRKESRSGTVVCLSQHCYSKITLERESLKEAIFLPIIFFFDFFIYPQKVPHL